MAIEPGNTRATAANLGTLTTQRLRNTVGGSDSLTRRDFYRFTLSSSSTFTAGLRRLRANADMALLDSSGTLLQQNRKSGTQNETIVTSLSAGTYFVRIRSGRQTTPYRLNLTATPSLPPPPITNTAPTLSGSLTLNALRGSVTPSSTTIASTVLNATDTQQPSDQLTYTLTTLPKQGSLFRDGVLLNIGSTFSQADINSNRISYRQQAIKTLGRTGTASTGFPNRVVISGKNAAWITGSGASAEVFFYNGTTGVTTQLTNDDREETGVRISGDTVVWLTRLGSNNNDIRYSINGGTVQSIDSSPELKETEVAISGQYIAFSRDNLSGFDVPEDGVYLFNTETRRTIQLRSGTENVGGIGVSSTPAGVNVVWQRGINPARADIEYSINGAFYSRIEAPLPSVYDYAPRISGQYIAFGRLDNAFFQAGVYLFDTSTLTLRLIELGSRSDGLPLLGELSGSNIVWQERRGSVESDVRYSIAGRPVEAIDTTRAFDDSAPYISGTNIVFERNQIVGDAEDGIYLFDASNPSAPLVRLSTSSFDLAGGIDGRNVVFVSGSQAFFYDGNTTSDSFGFTISDGSLTTNGTLNIAIV